MNAQGLADLLWFRTWWSYSQPGDRWFSVPYHAFNLFECGCWIVVAGLVARRCVRNRRSPAELVYALAFFTFGLTDLRESYALQSWLVWVKVLNLLALFWLRRVAITRWYPGSRLY